ncbi:hypothetical protein LTR78_007784 [Recurvomyces mirabilis]|uniref:2',3'-cyclic-nucleotide 3'-phosphodiesterase n=1 Tax=Recurvomyces mirabilis TaxID=574656 RepID=A0AAE0TTU7_9PEZI|nr:hypothetical protein LTR78_007784 [Recurvomyces mirabilis]
MPGSSLWLLPLPDSELYKTIQNLILQDVPAVYHDAAPPQFTPHITLTSDTISDQEDPQDWLDNITLPESLRDLQVNIKQLDAGNVFFQSLIMKCENSMELCELAVHCRVAGVKDTDAKAAETSGISREEVLGKFDDVKAKIKDVKKRLPGCRKATGAEIWLVPTFKTIDQWKPVARRRVEGVSWQWRT